MKVDVQQRACAGSPSLKEGYAIHVYAFTANMEDSCLCNADGDFLFVVQHGVVLLDTL